MESGELRRRKPLKIVKELDAFPKVPDSYQETTATGGGFSIVVFVIIGILIVSEIKYYSTTELEYDYEVDTNFDGKLRINVDITVAMRCDHIGADVLDLTGQNLAMSGKLQEESVHFELSPGQRSHFESTQSLNKYIREEYHSIHKFLWKSGFSSLSTIVPKREDTPTTPPDGCHLTGSLEVNKVAGNFHITAGKSVPVFPRGHAHLAMMVRDGDYNFSHRINHLSFGDPVAGKINPLDGEEKTVNANYHMFQYFIQVVPTSVSTTFSYMDSYQFAVTEKNRTIDHSQGSHGIPGIFIKYDLSALKVNVKETHKPYWQFVVRLCGIVGGMFATSGLIHGLVNFFYDTICCRYKIGKHKSPIERSLSESQASSASQKGSLVKNIPDSSLLSDTGLTQSVGTPVLNTSLVVPQDGVSLQPSQS